MRHQIKQMNENEQNSSKPEPDILAVEPQTDLPSLEESA